MANYLDVSGLKKVFEEIRDYLADNFLAKRKADVEAVLTGDVSSHTHSTYLPTAGGADQRGYHAGAVSGDTISAQ